MVTQPCMWPASANTWPVPLPTRERQQSGQRNTSLLGPPAAKLARYRWPQGLWEEEGIGDRDPTLRERRATACLLMHLQF